MKKIKTGVIGVGYLGRFHAQKYQSLEEVDLVGVADIDEERARVVAAECGCEYFTDHSALLDKVDAVSIAVPTSYHHRIASDALRAEKDVLLEKPMTVTLEEADDLIGLAEERNLILQVGHLERFNPAVLAMKPSLTTPVFIESKVESWTLLGSKWLRFTCCASNTRSPNGFSNNAITASSVQAGSRFSSNDCSAAVKAVFITIELR